MAITAASIEPNGWVLRLTLTGSPSPVATADTGNNSNANFAAYALVPNSAAPALVVAGNGSGFVQSGGTAVPSATVARSLIATKVLRKPVEATTAGTRFAKRPDETDNGDGTVTVRIALSQHFYQGDAGLTLTALAGWRSGEGAASGISVSNGSTVLAPAPIVRWADVPYKLQAGSFPLEVVVASHHPNGVAPVAGVRFTVTDGTTVKSYWATALADSAYPPKTDGTGQKLRVYGVTVDPTTATAFTKGILRCDFEVYPWLGPVQKSDTAGTRPMVNLTFLAAGTQSQIPFVVTYNPGGSYITVRYAYVDAVNGSATAAAANVSTDPAAAALTPLISPNHALESLRLWAVANAGSGGTLPAANGQGAVTQSVDGCRIRLKAGVVVGTGGISVTSGCQANVAWVVVEGDPADPNPRANCILRAGTSNNNTSRINRMNFRNLSVEAQGVAVWGSGYAWADNVEIRGVAGQEGTGGTPFGANGALLWLTGVKWWRHGTGPGQSGATQTIVMARGVSTERALNAPLVAGCARLPSAGGMGIAGSSNSTPGTDAGFGLERIAVGNDLRYLGGANYGLQSFYVANGSAPANLTLGKPYNVASRTAWINNVCEAYGGGFPLWGSVGENTTIVATENIIEGNTFAGDRTNNWYNDLNLGTVAANDTEDNIVRVNRFANNVTMKNASKHDAFNDSVVQAQRIGVALTSTRNKGFGVGAELVVAGSPANIYHCTTAGTTAASGGPTGTGADIVDGTVHWQWIAAEARQHGYRPQATGAWPSHYGVGYEGNIDYETAGDGNGSPEFVFEFYGLNSQSLYADGITITSTPFTLDKSGTGPNRQPYQPLPDGTGGGNYKPLATGSGVYALGRGRSASVDRDAAGGARAVPFAAGALEGGAGIAAVVPASARQASRAGASAVVWTTTLLAARAVMAMRASPSAIAGGTMLAPASSRLASRAAVSGIGWRVVLAPAGARSPSRAGATTLTWSGGLAPQGARQASRATAPVVTFGSVRRFVPDPARLAMVDRLVPVTPFPTPPERTLFVGGGCAAFPAG